MKPTLKVRVSTLLQRMSYGRRFGKKLPKARVSGHKNRAYFFSVLFIRPDEDAQESRSRAMSAYRRDQKVRRKLRAIRKKHRGY